MINVQHVADWVETFAPKRLAESWDNVGLLFGDPSARVTKIMTCLTVTPRVAQEAADKGAELIVSHHPVLFRATKHFRSDRDDTAALWILARAGVAVISPHTAFDNADDGINALLARLLGLTEVADLRPANRATTPALAKVVVFAAHDNHEAVINAAFEAGAGAIGDYRECSFSSEGTGTFYGLDTTNPTVGEPGRREQAPERRVEFVCPLNRLDQVLAATRTAHTYEEPAIDVYPLLDVRPVGPGSGRVGRLAAPTTLRAFAQKIKTLLHVEQVPYVGPADRPVSRVALCCGAGDDFLPDAIRLRADVLLTGEARFHRALEAESADIGLVLPGHHATERPGVEHLATRLSQQFPDLTIWPSQAEADPIRYA